jgi:hypothetical protein
MVRSFHGQTPQRVNSLRAEASIRGGPSLRPLSLVGPAVFLILLSSACVSVQAVPDASPAPTYSFEQITSLPDGWDGGFLSDIPCAPPCFAGITVGVTTGTEVMVLSQDSDYLRYCGQHDSDPTSRYVTCRGLIIHLQPTSDVTESISFWQWPQLTLAQVIAHFGEPDVVLVAPAGASRLGSLMLVFYDSPSTSLRFPEQGDSTYAVSNDTLVTAVSYCAADHCGFPQTELVPWVGYGTYGRTSP